MKPSSIIAAVLLFLVLQTAKPQAAAGDKFPPELVKFVSAGKAILAPSRSVLVEGAGDAGVGDAAAGDAACPWPG